MLRVVIVPQSGTLHHMDHHFLHDRDGRQRDSERQSSGSKIQCKHHASLTLETPVRLLQMFTLTVTTYLLILCRKFTKNKVGIEINCGWIWVDKKCFDLQDSETPFIDDPTSKPEVIIIFQGDG